MSLFKRSKASGASVPSIPREALAQLPAIGRAVFVDHQLVTDVSQFYLPVLGAVGYPSPGSPQWHAFVTSFIGDLVAGAGATDEWAIVGAFHVARDLLGADLSNQGYVDLVDRAVAFLHQAGISLGAVPPFAYDRWRVVNGGDGTW